MSLPSGLMVMTTWKPFTSTSMDKTLHPIHYGKRGGRQDRFPRCTTEKEWNLSPDICLPHGKYDHIEWNTTGTLFYRILSAITLCTWKHTNRHTLNTVTAKYIQDTCVCVRVCVCVRAHECVCLCTMCVCVQWVKQLYIPELQALAEYPPLDGSPFCALKICSINQNCVLWYI